MEDRSLDEFLNVDDEDGGETDDSGDDHSGADESGDASTAVEAGDATATDEGAEGDAKRVSDDVDPATATATWAPGGGACADCGRTVRRRWQGEDGLVCDGCKEW